MTKRPMVDKGEKKVSTLLEQVGWLAKRKKERQALKGIK